ncbi:TPX2 (targeting protein for Xklp2) protein family [Euphorbia peplus]|nr:TPX2 (targeting protein for Xklp2) protein family [Euphorbia peplus]
MESISKSSKSVTPMKDKSKTQEVSRENSNPNVVKSSKSAKSASKNLIGNQNVVLYSPRKKIRERKFVVAKKSKKDNASSDSAVECKCKDRFGGNAKKCLCVAYETLRASQEEFFKAKAELDREKASDDAEDKEIETGFMAQEAEIDEGVGSGEEILKEDEKLSGIGVSAVKRRRDRILEAGRNSIPAECGKVMHMVKIFEEVFSIKDPEESEKKDDEKVKEEKKKGMRWALPGFQQPDWPEIGSNSSSLTGFHPYKACEMNDSPSSLAPEDLFLNSENLGLDPRFSASSSWDGSQGSVSSRTSNAGRRSRRNSSESCGTMGGNRWKKKQQRITSQKPFRLRTEQRGRMKEEEFMKKVQQMMIEEEKLRIPVAQGLPYTTDEPECLIKPPVKESTRPVDLVLNSDIRAVERADFDQQVAEKLSAIEQYRMERERQRKLAEEEEVRRLRKELVPKAQPMPYFDRPFIPRRSMKHPTVPRDPKFHIPEHKKMKCCQSWDDMSMSTFTYE